MDAVLTLSFARRRTTFVPLLFSPTEMLARRSSPRPLAPVRTFAQLNSPSFELFCTSIEIASEGLKGRVFELSLADLNGGDESQAYRKVKLVCEDVQGTNIITNFHGMDITRDKLCSLIRKWQTLIEAHIDVRTTDGYVLRVFCIGFTKKQSSQGPKSTCYAQSGQIRSIRKNMFEIINEEASKSDMKELLQKL